MVRFIVDFWVRVRVKLVARFSVKVMVRFRLRDYL